MSIRYGISMAANLLLSILLLSPQGAGACTTFASIGSANYSGGLLYQLYLQTSPDMLTLQQHSVNTRS